MQQGQSCSAGRLGRYAAVARASASLIVCAFAVAGCEPGDDAIFQETLTVEWQRANCPGGADLAALRKPDGTLAEVTIYEVGDERLYVPTEWFRYRHRNGRRQIASKQGVFAQTGGRGHFESFHPGFPGNMGKPRCLGIVHKLVPGEVGGRGSDFSIELQFEEGTTNSPDGRVERHASNYSFTAMRFNFRFDGRYDADDIWNQPLPDPLPQQREPFENGWSRAEWYQEVGPPLMLYFDEEVGRDPLNPSFVGVEILASYDFWFRVSETMTAKYELSHKVPTHRWRDYRQPVRRIYAWLKTPPNRRDNDRRLSF